jgi:hypothetical protein
MLLGCLLLPFALAAGTLFVMDRRTLRKNLSAEQREALVDSRTGRWLRYYGFFFFILAVIAFLVNAPISATTHCDGGLLGSSWRRSLFLAISASAKIQ